MALSHRGTKPPLTKVAMSLARARSAPEFPRPAGPEWAGPLQGPARRVPQAVWSCSQTPRSGMGNATSELSRGVFELKRSIATECTAGIFNCSDGLWSAYLDSGWRPPLLRRCDPMIAGDLPDPGAP